MEIKIEGMDEMIKELKEFPKALARAERNAINTTATAVKNLGLDEAYKTYNIDKKSRLKKDSKGRELIYVKRARENETAVVTFKGGDTPKYGDRPGLQHFKTDKQERNKKQKGWKPSVQVRRGGKVEQIDNAFYGVGKLKGQGIFQRQEGSRKIVRRTGPSIKQMIEGSEVYSQVKDKGQTILMQKMIEAVDKQLAKIGGK